MFGLGQGFKGYNRWVLSTLLIKIRYTRHTPLAEIDLYPDEDTIPLIRVDRVFSTLNVEP